MFNHFLNINKTTLPNKKLDSLKDHPEYLLFLINIFISFGDLHNILNKYLS
jgi:hypothetical protein